MRIYNAGSNNRTAVTLDTREERVAKRFSERRGLTVPFDVDEIAKSLADLREVAIPAKIDGLCRDVKGRSGRPEIWVQKGLRERRRRFTIAHEIGHLVIPWHTGSIVDELDVEESDEAANYFRMESEANRFAAELLMPKEWASALVDRSEHMQNAMKAIYDIAGVSAQAAALRIVQLGPPGYVMSAVRDGVIQRSSKTVRTASRLPIQGEFIENVRMDTHFAPLTLSIGATTYYWWKERDAIAAPPDPNVAWRVVLNDIAESIPSTERHEIKQRINAIIAMAIRFFPKGSDVGPMYLSVKRNLENRQDHNPWLSAALAHSRFEEYVLARLYERSRQKP